jgi:hypothetical protein
LLIVVVEATLAVAETDAGTYHPNHCCTVGGMVPGRVAVIMGIDADGSVGRVTNPRGAPAGPTGKSVGDVCSL